MAQRRIKQRLGRFLLLCLSVFWIGGVVYAYQLSPMFPQVNAIDEEETPQSVLEKYQTELSEVYQSYKGTIESYYDVVQNEYLPQLESTYNTHYGAMQSLYDNYDDLTQDILVFSSDMYNECVAGKNELREIYNAAQSRQTVVNKNEVALQDVQKYQTELSEVYNTYKEEIESLDESVQGSYLSQLFDVYNSFNVQLQTLIDNYYVSYSLSDHVNEAADYCSSGKTELKNIRDNAFETTNPVQNPSISLQEVPFWLHEDGLWGLNAPKNTQVTAAWVVGESTGVPYGDSMVNNWADLSGYDKLVVTVTEGAPRILLNRDVDEGSWNDNEEESHLIDNSQGGWSSKYFTQETTTNGDVYTVDLKQIKTDKGFVHLHAIKGANWQNVTVTSMMLELDGDPEVVITSSGDGTVDWSIPTGVGVVNANSQSDAISVQYDGELTLTFTPNTGYHLSHVYVNNVDYVNQVFGNALTLNVTQNTAVRAVFATDTNNVQLTADMFYDWDGFGPFAQKTGQTTQVYVVGEPTEVAYGDPNVISYADLSAYSRLEVTVTEGTPRFLFNREYEYGLWCSDETMSHMIEYPNEGWSSKYFSHEGNVWSVDLKQMVADKGYAHLHAIKAPWNTEITVTKMELVDDGDNVYPEAYAVPSEGNTTLTFYYDTNKSSHEDAMSVVPFSSSESRGWDSYASNITKVEFDKSFANCLTLTSTANWFSGCNNLTTINGIRYIKTPEVTDMQQMFFSCSSLTSLDLSSFNTAKVSSMLQMFFGCSALTTIYVGSGWNVASLSNAEIMFEGCDSLVGGYGTAYDANYIDNSYARIDHGTSNPGYLTGREPLINEMMFAWDDVGAGAQKTSQAYSDYVVGESTDNAFGRANVETNVYVDLSSYSRLEVTTTTGTPRFLLNRDVTDGEPSENEAESHLIDSGHEGCMTWASKYFSSKPIDGGTLWTVNLEQLVQDKGFAHLHAIKGANDANVTVTKMDLVIAQNVAIEPEAYAVWTENYETNPDTGDEFYIQKLTFYYDTNKNSFNGLDNTTVYPIPDGGATHEWGPWCLNFHRVVFDESFALYQPTSTASWFDGMENLTSINGIENLKTDNVTDMNSMFLGCKTLTSIDLSHFNTASVTNMARMFYGCSALETLDMTSFNTSKVMYMGEMFYNCAALKTIYVGSEWTTAALTGSESMFAGCSSLVGGRGTTYDADHTDASYAHIDGGTANPGYFTDKNAPAVNDTIEVVGNTDLSSAFWSAFSSNYEIPADYTLHMQFVNHSAKASNWDNWVMLCTADSTRTPEYFVLRADRYGWGDYHNADGFTTNWEDWDQFREAMDGALVDFTVRRWGSEVKVTSISKATDGTELIQTYTTTVAPAESQSVNVFLTVDYAYLEIYKNTITLTPTEAPAEPEPYAVLSADSLTVTFYYDDQKASRGGMEINNNYIDSDQNSPYGSAATAIIDDSFAGYRPTSTAYWFASCSNLTAIEGMANLNTANVTDMGNMFQGCSGLTNLDVSGFNTANVTDMGGMFDDCSGLTSLDVSGFNTANVTDMKFMFYHCSGLTSFDVSGFNTANVTDMGSMFSSCSGLTSLDLSNFKTDNVTDMTFMFSGCSSLTSLDLSSFNTQNVTSMTNMFMACSSLTSLDVTHFNTQNVMWMGVMFAGCSSLTSLDLSSFNTQNVTLMGGMFSDCSSLMTIYVGDGWSTASVTNGEDMFTGCTSLVGGAGTAYDSLHVDYTYAHIDGGISNPGYFTSIESLRRWDFTKWSSETIANLKADAANSKITGWSDVEKRADAEADSEPTEAAKDNCFWLDAETTDANGVAIAELEGLVFDANYCSRRSLAIAVNYPSTSLGDYAGGAYLWLGGKNYDCFTIPNVKNGQTITIEVESHNASDARGITLIAGSTELESFTPTAKASYSWTITEDCDVIVRNTNGCHIYTITVEGAGIPTNSLEIYAVETNSTITPNQPIMATQSVVVTPGNDTEWGTKYSIGIDHDSQINTIEFVASIYYPNNTTSQVFNGSMYGTNNPRDGELVEGTSTGNSYKHYLKNLPHSGGYVVFEPLQDGSLIVPIHVNAEKQFYVVDGNGKALTDIQIKDANGQTLKLLASPLCAISTESTTTAFVSLNVKQGERYYMFCTGSKMRFGGYVFSKQSIEIDSTTMAGVKDLLESEPYAVLSEENTVLTFYYDKKREERGGRVFQSGTEVYWPNYVTGVTKVSFNESFAGFLPTSTSSWFAGFNSLTSVEGMEYLNTEHVTSMISMFQYCENLTALDLSGLQTGNVETMTNMFYGCQKLANLNISGFNTANVTSLASMFYGCQSLTTIDLSSFNTSNVTRMEEMFQDCAGLTTLDLTNFNTENVENMTLMFAGCTNLATIYAGSGWSVAKAADSRQMFDNCTSLVGGQGTVYDAEYTDKTYAHIDGGTSNPGYLTLKLAMGDANGDGNINIADAVATVTNILGQPTEATFYQYAADMNTDQVIDIFDVTLIVNAAFDAASPAPVITRGSADNIMMEHISMTADADYIYLGIDQPERFTATQFDVTLTEGMELVDARLASATTDHQLSFVKRGENEYRVIGLSMSNATFRSMNGQLIKLEVSGSAVDSDVKVSNVLFVTPTAAVMTSIDKCLNTAKVADDSFYDLKGQRVSKQQLGKGIYIMNHKKVMIK